jgi:hypothetical protein
MVIEGLLHPQIQYPVTPDGSLPIEYQIMLDPRNTYVCAANTNKIVLGTSPIGMLFHNRGVLARRFATLDVLSEGRTLVITNPFSSINMRLLSIAEYP